MTSSAGPCAVGSSTGPVPPPFPPIPDEILFLIIDFASMGLPSASSLRSSSSLALDVPTTLSLTLVSRRIYPHIASILYSHITITRPSKLEAFTRTILSRPALGRLVKSLWAGHDDVDPSTSAWPIDEENLRMRSKIKDSNQLPLGVTLDKTWQFSTERLRRPRADDMGVESDVADDEIDRQVYLFISRVRATIGDDGAGFGMDTGRSYDCSNYFGANEWTLRIYVAQTYLDAYLRALRAAQDDYIRAHASESTEGELLRQAQSWQFVEKTGATIREQSIWRRYLHPLPDRFEHVALFARSGALSLVLGSSILQDFEEVQHDQQSEEEAEEQYFTTTQRHPAPVDGSRPLGLRSNRELPAEDIADLFSVSLGPGERRLHYSSMSLQPDGTPSPTLGSLLATLKALLSMLPYLEHLALTGYLERAVGGNREGVELRRLRSLSLGPPPPFWNSPLRLNRKSLRTVEWLHIAGCMLFNEEATCIGGFHGALPRLQRARWTMWAPHSIGHPLDIHATLNLMLGRSSPPARGGQPTSALPSPSTSTRQRQVTILAELHPTDIRNDRLSKDKTLREDKNLSVVSMFGSEDSFPVLDEYFTNLDRLDDLQDDSLGRAPGSSRTDNKITYTKSQWLSRPELRGEKPVLRRPEITPGGMGDTPQGLTEILQGIRAVFEDRAMQASGRRGR